ncbi:sensor histidine kinase [Paenibacillus nasutitermitis]|uniref:Sensor histidine kinase YesM n=1 Tax=Paenibacillus nasutitermitis TaxID=1652958 RepID=A0A917DNK5_9BACL|nr:histidine kinase [Paenibacillus nasutitermitis]GGD51523.1 sensor histidine kinase YesM [Paenibacillus nasutitermitis]
MKMLLTLWKRGIFRRLLSTFLVVVIPICLLGINFFNLGMSAVKKEISNSIQSQINFYFEHFEKEMDRIKLLQSDLINDVNLNKIANLPETMNLYDRTSAILSLQQRLQAIKNSSTYIKDIIVLLPASEDEIKITATNGLSKITSNDKELLDNIPDKSHNYFSFWENRLFLSFFSPLEFNKNTHSSPFVIAVELTEKEIRMALNQFNNYQDSGAVLMNPLHNYILTTGDNPIVEIPLKKYLGERIEKKKMGNDLVEIKGRAYQVFYALSAHSNLVLAKYIPEKFMFERLKGYSNWLWFFSATSLIIIILFSYSTYKYIHKPMVKLVSSFRKVENGDLNVFIEHHDQDEFRYLFQRFNVMVENTRTLIDQVYKQKILAQKAELKQLQSQINPHFLYNSYFTLYSMLENEDYDNSKRFAQQIGGYFQYMTRNASDEVSFAAEVAHARIYAEIQARRFRNRMRLEFEDLPPGYENIIVPRLIIQPLIENAFEHGLENTMSAGIVKVRFTAMNRFLYVIVEDNGNGMSESDLDILAGNISGDADVVEITGIMNIHQRIRMKFGPLSGVEVYRGSGLMVKIAMEFERERRMDA